MARRSEQRDAAKAEYCARRAAGEKVNLRELAQALGAGYDTVRRWKVQDAWEEAVPRKRGGQPGNKNSKGHKNAKGNAGGAPVQNKNAEKDGAYSQIFFDRLTEQQQQLLREIPKDAVENLRHELAVLRLREHRILEKITEYEGMGRDELYLNTVTDMGGTIMKNKETPFVRVMKLQEALYKVQGRIAAVLAQMRQAEENDRRYELEVQRTEIAMMRATGEVIVEE